MKRTIEIRFSDRCPYVKLAIHRVLAILRRRHPPRKRIPIMTDTTIPTIPSVTTTPLPPTSELLPLMPPS